MLTGDPELGSMPNHHGALPMTSSAAKKGTDSVEL